MNLYEILNDKDFKLYLNSVLSIDIEDETIEKMISSICNNNR